MTALRRWIGFALPLALGVVGSAGGQDFVSPGLPGPSPSPLSLLERGLPGAGSAARADAAITRWFGLPDLTTRALAVGGGWRSLRAAMGASQTGERDLGWSAFGVAWGFSGPAGGAACRAAARRDRTPSSTGSALGTGVGAEAGGGAWVAVGRRWRVWASAPQVWSGGNAPPLARSLEVGAVLATGDLAVWLVRTAPARTSASGDRAGGVALDSGPWTVWLEARDRPLRGGLGVAGRAGRLRTAVGIESHPVLGETVKWTLGVVGGRP